MRLYTILWASVVLIANSGQTSNEDILEEPEGFNEFLEEPVDEKLGEDDEYSSAHAWENSGKFEGDMVLERDQRNVIEDQVVYGIMKNGFKDLNKRWPNKTVVYFISTEDFAPGAIDIIKQAMKEIENISCIQFRIKSQNDRNYVRFVGRDRGCYSKVGFIGGEQVVNLAKSCYTHGAIIHEILHTLGFFHMQGHYDRDNFVKIEWNNIIAGEERNFKKYHTDTVTDFNVPYDYGSIMHYGEKAFSKNQERTIIPLNRNARIGQSVRLSSGDIQKINLMYDCVAPEKKTNTHGIQSVVQRIFGLL